MHLFLFKINQWGHCTALRPNVDFEFWNLACSLSRVHIAGKNWLHFGCSQEWSRTTRNSPHWWSRISQGSQLKVFLVFDRLLMLANTTTYVLLLLLYKYHHIILHIMRFFRARNYAIESLSSSLIIDLGMFLDYQK